MTKQYIRCQGIYSRDIEGTWVILLSTRKACLELNDVAGVLWEAVKTPKTIQELSKLLCSVYDIDDKTAKHDVEDFIASYQQKGLIDEV